MTIKNTTSADIIRRELFNLCYNSNNTDEENAKKIIHCINSALAATIPGYSNLSDHEKFNIFMIYTFMLKSDFKLINDILAKYFYNILREAGENEK